MLRAVFVRTLKDGVSYQQFRDAWVPDDIGPGYPAKVGVARNVANDRQVLTILELDMTLAEFEQRRTELTRPDSLDRLAEIVETTELAGVYQEVFDDETLRQVG